jgi:hypothetical protein
MLIQHTDIVKIVLIKIPLIYIDIFLYFLD